MSLGLCHWGLYSLWIHWVLCTAFSAAWGQQEASLSSVTHNHLPSVGTLWSDCIKATVIPSCSFSNMASYNTSTSHLPWWGHSSSMAIWKSVHAYGHILLYYLAFCSQEPQVALSGLNHTLQPEKAFSYKIFMRSQNKTFPYCFLLSFKDNQEKSSLLPLGNQTI